jgi:hypothetical protein
VAGEGGSDSNKQTRKVSRRQSLLGCVAETRCPRSADVDLVALCPALELPTGRYAVVPGTWALKRAAELMDRGVEPEVAIELERAVLGAARGAEAHEALSARELAVPTRNFVSREDSHTRARQVCFRTRLPYIEDKRCRCSFRGSSRPSSAPYSPRGPTWSQRIWSGEAAGIEPCSAPRKKRRRCATFVVKAERGNELQANSLSP